jgi:hypothetical protein
MATVELLLDGTMVLVVCYFLVSYWSFYLFFIFAYPIYFLLYLLAWMGLSTFLIESALFILAGFSLSFD